MTHEEYWWLFYICNVLGIIGISTATGYLISRGFGWGVFGMGFFTLIPLAFWFDKFLDDREGD